LQDFSMRFQHVEGEIQARIETAFCFHQYVVYEIQDDPEG
jgi:hypothetical protein